MRVVGRNTLGAGYSNMMMACNWIPLTGELLSSSVPAPDEEGPGGSSGGGSAFGGSPGPSGPMIPVPPHDVANVGISIIVGDNTYDAGYQYGCCTGTSDGYM